MSTSFLAFLQQASELPPIPIGRFEQMSIVALETGIIWVLWRAFREKDQQLQEVLKSTIENDTRQVAVLERVERLLDSSKS